MKKYPSHLILTLIIAFTFIFLPWISFTAEDKPRFSDECLDCHEDYDKTLAGSMHELQGPDHSLPVMCSDCHTGAEVHIDDPEISNITNPSTASIDEAATICRSCHYTDHQQHMSERSVHAENDVGCTTCHKIHDNNRCFQLLNQQSELCYTCHAGVRGEFSYPYRHPVTDGIMKCSDCHRQLDRIGEELEIGGLSKPCYDCHNEFQGPFPFEHQAAVDYSTEEGGCLNCHAAHGSNLPRLLTQPIEPPNFVLCSQCHLVPGHQFNSYHQDRWADRPCGTCHVDIHGSYISKFLLKPSLPEEEGLNCFGAGCHEL